MEATELMVRIGLMIVLLHVCTVSFLCNRKPGWERLAFRLAEGAIVFPTMGLLFSSYRIYPKWMIFWFITTVAVYFLLCMIQSWRFRKPRHKCDECEARECKER